LEAPVQYFLPEVEPSLAISSPTTGPAVTISNSVSINAIDTFIMITPFLYVSDQFGFKRIACTPNKAINALSGAR
jgi:hypothetical protein